MLLSQADESISSFSSVVIDVTFSAFADLTKDIEIGPRAGWYQDSKNGLLSNGILMHCYRNTSSLVC